MTYRIEHLTHEVLRPPYGLGEKWETCPGLEHFTCEQAYMVLDRLYMYCDGLDAYRVVEEK